jgi:aldose 1-epimerase
VARLLTGAQHYIRAGDYQASITELGAGLRELTYRGRKLIIGYQPDELPPGGAGQLLLPWPNRVDGGTYDFGGASYQLDLSEPARCNAIHGLTRWANWEVAAQPVSGRSAADTADGAADDSDLAASQITLAHMLHGRPGYPFCIELSVSYRLEPASGLRVSVTACNTGSRPCTVRHGLTSVPHARDASHRRLRAPDPCLTLAADRRARHTVRTAAGRDGNALRLPDIRADR